VKSWAPALPLAALALVSAFSLGAPPRAAASAPPAAVSPVQSNRLFVENAASGTLARASNGTMSLRLVGVSATVWFTDRPMRKSGVEETATFVAGWGNKGGFAKDPPNAVLEGRVKGVRRVLPVELLSARFTPETATVDYTVRPLPRGPRFYQGTGADPKLGEGSFGSSSLFVDDATNQSGCFVQWTIPNVAPLGYNTQAGLQIDSGGTFSYTFGNEIQTVAGGLLYSFVAQGGNIGATGPEQWHAQSDQLYFGGQGMIGGTVQFLTWFQPAPGATILSGTVLGAGALPTAFAPSIFSGSCPRVDVADTAPAYPFTVYFQPPP
jgi:hypothetical protein